MVVGKDTKTMTIKRWKKKKAHSRCEICNIENEEILGKETEKEKQLDPKSSTRNSLEKMLQGGESDQFYVVLSLNKLRKLTVHLLCLTK